MKWHEELKIIRSLVPPEAVNLNMMRMPVDMVDRLIAITERSEWAEFDGIVHDKTGIKHWYCSLCSRYQDDGHDDFCHYSDNWKQKTT